MKSQWVFKNRDKLELKIQLMLKKHKKYVQKLFFKFSLLFFVAYCRAVRKQWPDSLKECYNVDSSSEMNDIAELLLKGGDPEAPLPIPSVFYRQFLNSDSEVRCSDLKIIVHVCVQLFQVIYWYMLQRKYNLVVSSYSLLDLPSQEIRLKTLSNLWNKTEDFLVLVENGTSAGFNVISQFFVGT